MPFVSVKLVEGVFDTGQKREIIERLTETMVRIEGENMREVTSAVIEEVRSGDWGIGGKGSPPRTSRLSPQEPPHRSSLPADGLRNGSPVAGNAKRLCDVSPVRRGQVLQCSIDPECVNARS